MVRESVVRELMRVANDAMIPIVERTDASPAEIMSAYLSLARVAILTAQMFGIKSARLRRAVHELLAALQRLQPEAWRAYCQRLLDLECSFFLPGTLRKKRKLLRLVDERSSGLAEWAQQAIQVVKSEE